MSIRRWFRPRSITHGVEKISVRGSIPATLAYLKAQGDGDSLPPSREFSSLRSGSQERIAVILASDLAKHTWSQPFGLAIVRYPGRIRRITQFEPIDSLLLTAIMYAIGSRIEVQRIPTSQKQVFSYRFNPSERGDFFQKASWNAFAQTGMKCASEYEFVLKLDIQKFYESLPHAVLNDALTKATVPQGYRGCILGALKQASPTEVGLPIGPHFSHLLAELCLDDVDRALARLNITFCRFVDDIHIFANTREEIRAAELAVSERLGSLGLSLNKAKCELIHSADYLADIDEKRWAPMNEAEQKLANMLSKKDGIYLGRPLEIVRGVFNSAEIEQLFSPKLNCEGDYTPVLRLLRRLRSCGVADGVRFAIDHLIQLTPVALEVLEYIEASATPKLNLARRFKNALFEFYAEDVVRNGEYLQILILRALLNISQAEEAGDFLNRLPYLTRAGQRELNDWEQSRST